MEYNQDLTAHTQKRGENQVPYYPAQPHSISPTTGMGGSTALALATTTLQQMITMQLYCQVSAQLH